MSVSKEFAQYVTRLTYAELPQEVVAFAKICILDWLGSALAGSSKAPIHMLAQVAQELGGSEQATLVTGGRSSVTHAALVNGASSHIVELDDIHKASIIHAGTVVIPAALAVAEWKQKSGRELIEAIVAGYEVCYRIGEAVSPSHYYFWHNTATCGTFGAAVAASKLLGQREEQIVHTLGSAGTQAAGLWEFIEDGAMSKQLHPGKAAMNGILAALLAEKGFTGASRILEGKRGFVRAMSQEVDPEQMTQGLGTTHKIMENSFKIHASCRHTHHAIDLIVAMMAEHGVSWQKVERVRVRTYQVALTITDNPDPGSVYAAKFSLQYCVALALVKGSAGLHDFTEEALYDPVIREVMRRVEVCVDPDIDARYPRKWEAAAELDLADGTTICQHAEYPKGDPENPVTHGQIVQKFRTLALDQPKDTIEHYLQMIDELEHVPDVAMFFAQMKGRGRA
ncbi:MmgE/PrpD family protein [Brevibacillus choshinensis]|uniref:MmgE/PrpD family protein n=1 Tax=Brevibacillus choshinensis TaxID=54911 RepID=A0ABX7FTF8_BRECH|nr:MmgE/PrpD family protein [Brevibacillus choshinensis]QRG69035.1 MmgE/PrpD family protein [Brevibacillus choshinensis]